MGDIAIRFGMVTPRMVSGEKSNFSFIQRSYAKAPQDILSVSPNLNKNPPMHKLPPTVVAVVYDEMNLFELGIVAEVFGSDRPEFKHPLFKLRFAHAEAGVLRAVGGIRIHCNGGLGVMRRADIVVIPGWRNPASPVPRPLQRALMEAHARGAQIVSICAGAFVLASTGLLDGRPTTTHWRYAECFRQQYPKVHLDPKVLYLDDGEIMTSAGSAAGIDACLQVVRQHYGSEVANAVARAMVTSPHRLGGQAQYISQPVAIRANRSLAPLLEWVRNHIGSRISVSSMAARAAMSDRTLLRKFHSEVGMTPMAWLQQERVQAAQRLLESGNFSVERVAESVGYSTVGAFRSAFRLATGVSPTTYQDRFNQ